MNDGSNDFMNKGISECCYDTLCICNNTSRNGVNIMITLEQIKNAVADIKMTSG